MKTKYITSLMGLSIIVNIGCTDLNTFPESEIITADQKEEVIKNDPTKVSAGVNSIFAQFSAFKPIVDTDLDVGYPSIMLFSDSNGNDMVAQDNGYNWFSEDMAYKDRNYQSKASRVAWGNLYKMIYVTNKVMAGIDPNANDVKMQFYLGQALAARAFDYWVLAQLYQFNYVDHKSSPCVPIITEKNSKQVEAEGCKRNTVEQVYTQIKQDLKQAIICLENAEKAGIKRSDKRYIDLGVAYGLSARVNLTMGEWAAAAADAKKAIEVSGIQPYSKSEVSVPTMWDANDNSWMWGIVIAESDRVVTSQIINWPSHLGTMNYGYSTYASGRQINKKLYESIAPTDVRKGWWTNENKTSVNLVNMDNKQKKGTQFQNFALDYPPYTQVKFGPYKNVLMTTLNANDIPLMRVEEMYLIKAEGEAMSGNLSDAKNTLESFIKNYRDENYACNASTAEKMQEEIFRQRRIELWGEGLSWFDIMRLNKGVDRRGAGYSNATMIFNIPAGDKIMLWRLPELEMQANKALKATDNNPTAPVPTPVPDVK